MKHRELKILFIIGSLDVGGTEQQMSILASRLQSVGCFCRVFSLQSEGPLDAHLRRKSLPVHDGGLKKGDMIRAPWKLARAEWRLIRVIRTWRPDVVHAYLPLVTFMGALAGCLCGVPLVVTSRRGMGNHQQRHQVLKPLDRLANALSHRITVNSRAVWDDVIRCDRVDPSKLVLIYNGVDWASFESALRHRFQTRRSLGIGNHEKIVIVVANLIPYKGHHDFIEALKKVVVQIPEVKVLLVGEDRGIQKDVEKQAEGLGIRTFIQFLGKREDVPCLLAAADLSVLPSHEEGFSNVILESMAAGLPVVATRVGGNSEAVVDEVSGWLVPPRNSSLMAEKIVDILIDKQRATSWGKRGMDRVRKNFTIEEMVEAHLNLYEGQV